MANLKDFNYSSKKTNLRRLNGIIRRFLKKFINHILVIILFFRRFISFNLGKLNLL